MSEQTNSWQVAGLNTYIPSGTVVSELPSDVYSIDYIPGGVKFDKINAQWGDIIDLPGGQSDEICKSVERFWASKGLFDKAGLLYKRGVLLAGEPGMGKSGVLALAVKSLIDKGGVALRHDNPYDFSVGLKEMRRVEPNRPIIALYEDIDETMAIYGEKKLLSILDGEDQVDNVVHIATTNNLDHLPTRFSGRPSRFDQVVTVGPPNEATRRAYITAKFGSMMSKYDLEKWIAKTAGLGIAHIKELGLSNLCFENDFDTTLNNLFGMSKGANVKNIESGPFFGRREEIKK